MASIATHFSTALILVPVGLRRLFCSSSLFLKNPSLFRSKTWYLSDTKWKNVDLYILTIALPIASFSEIFLFLSFSGHPTYRFSFLHQSLVLLLYWVLTFLFLLRNSIDPLALNDNFLFAFTGIVFFIEYSVIGNGISGLIDGAVYGLCRDLTIICGCCCLYLAIRPNAFFVEFCFCCALLLRGTWFLQAGLSLYNDFFVFKGCHKIMVSPENENADMKCDLEEDGLRGVALANLLFIGHVIAVLLVSFGVFGLLTTNRISRHGEASGALLAGLESDSHSIRQLPEFELE
ncbi:hypothetical protein JCGZ_02377 [Jatropha curcas]|uniref:Uncharacterized protein n=1 Tax=Jatropha curcas TaxID=180498 RepID=A0A067L8E0_JATCU|nr:uncharacterized protein LOC105632183 [Jatropha curcas]KDP40379.1 hypothetical protein JCGZ_02377 [Jatropha curcas]